MEVYVRSRAEWRKWLSDHYDQTTGIWLVYDKGGDRALSYEDIVEEAICYGWIDSKAGKVSETRSKIWVAPRNPKSNWSALNKKRVAQLAKDGKLAAPGKAMIALAKKTGTWDALNDVENLIIPADLSNEFKKYKHAKEFFDAFPRSVKRAILEWIHSAKKEETRNQRVAETAELADKNIRANQWRQ